MKFMLTIVVALVATMVGANGTVYAGTTSAAEDANVLSAVLQEQCESAAKLADGKYYVLNGGSENLTFPEVLSMLAPKAKASIVARNKVMRKLPNIKTCLHIKRVSGVVIRNIFNSAGWREFYKDFPKAYNIISFSLPGYTPDGNTAVVQVSFTCGGECGSGYFVVLEKVHGEWVIKRRGPAWVS